MLVVRSQTPLKSGKSSVKDGQSSSSNVCVYVCEQEKELKDMRTLRGKRFLKTEMEGCMRTLKAVVQRITNCIVRGRITPPIRHWNKCVMKGKP